MYFATGGVSSEPGSINHAPYTDTEVQAIVSEAHRQGVHVAAHDHGAAVANTNPVTTNGSNMRISESSVCV